MTVSQLIARLAIEDPDMRIVVNGYESGYDEFEKALYVYIKPKLHNNNSEKDKNWWDGEFEQTNDTNNELALLLPRKS